MKKKLLAIIALVLTVSLLLCACGKGGSGDGEPETGAPETQDPAVEAPPSDADDQEDKDSDDGAAGEFEAFHIGLNSWGTAPILTLYGDEAAYAIDITGLTHSRASDDNSADKELQNIQNFISQQVDGLCIQGGGATTIPQMALEAANAEIPFVLYIFVGTPEVREELKSNEYFAGAVASDLQADGYILAQKAIEDGNKTACMIGGNIGDLNMDNRSAGFRRGFEEGGGTIVAEERCTDNSEALSKASSMLSANPDVDCIYIMVGDYVEGTITALDTLGIEDTMCYLSAVNEGSAPYIRSGQIAAGSGGTTFSCNVAPTLLLNMLDGHKIVDENGNAPDLSVPTSLVTADNVDDYVKVFLTDGVHPVSEDVLKSLCYRFNPDVTYQHYLDVIANDLTVEACIEAFGK